MIKILKNFIWAIALYLVYALSGFISEGNHRQMIVAVLIATFFFTLLYFKSKPKQNGITGFSILIIPFISLLIIVSFFSGFKQSLTYILFVPVVAYLSWIYIKTEKRLLIGITIICVIICAPLFFLPNLYSYYLNSNAKQNMTLPELGWLDSNKEPIQLPKDKVVVLDFWNTGCVPCFKKFPEFEDLYLDYKNNPEVEFYSVNVPLKRDVFSSTKKLMDSLNYQFKTIYTTSAANAKKLPISGYPTFMIIKNNQIRFSGYQNNGFNIFVYNSKSEIDVLLNE